jgi:hypothetical protein
MAQSVTRHCHPLGLVHVAFCCVTTQLADPRLLMWRIWIIVAAVESRRLQTRILPSSSSTLNLPPLCVYRKSLFALSVSCCYEGLGSRWQHYYLLLLLILLVTWWCAHKVVNHLKMVDMYLKSSTYAVPAQVSNWCSFFCNQSGQLPFCERHISVLSTVHVLYYRYVSLRMQ